MGKVLAVDMQRMEIQLAPRKSGKMAHPFSENEKILVRLAKENNLPRESDEVVFPGCVSLGMTIRLWGTRASTEEGIFVVTDIRGCRGKGCSDPTGVRSRLLSDREHKRHGFHSSDYGNGRGEGGGGGGGGGGGR